MSIKTVQPMGVVRYVAAFGMAALSFGAGSAYAEEMTDASRAKTTVAYSDLDLSKDSDVRSLYARLQRASQKVCGQYQDLRNLRTKRLYDACYQDSLARAVDDVGHASVKAVFAADERIRVAGRSSKTQARS